MSLSWFVRTLMSTTSSRRPAEDRRDDPSPEQRQALSDSFRLRLFDLVRDRAASISELAAMVERPKSTVSHHVGVLVDAGLLQVARTLRVRGVDQRFYGRATQPLGGSTEL